MPPSSAPPEPAFAAAGAARLLDAGETALVVEYGSTVDPAIHDRVLRLDMALRAADHPGIVETVPTYRSLMIHYDPLTLARPDLAALVRAVETAPAAARDGGTLWVVPACYDPEIAEDIAAVAAAAGLSVARVQALHVGAVYRVYMYGFAPGFCYLGGLPAPLAVRRRETPRPPHPPNALLIGGGLAAIATVSMPTGWYVVGCTPERLFSLARDPGFLVEVGDTVRFEAVDRDAFAALSRRAEGGEVVARRRTPA